MAKQRNSVLTHPATRLMRGVNFDLNTGCWMWAFGGVRDYGRLGVKGKKILAHRLSYQIFVGPIPDGLCVLHSCDNPGCVNPFHLFLGTHLDNMRDMAKKGRAKVIPQFGSTNPGAKLVEDDVIAIRQQVADGGSQKDAASQYGVSVAQIYRIVNHEAWQHIERAEE